MKHQSLVIANKEIIDGLRDSRSLISSALFALMGPLVVAAVSLAPSIKESNGSALIGLMSVFTLIAAFTGGMNVAMDTVAGERERHSLLPLLLNAVHRRNVAAGKWLAVSLFSVAGLTLNILGFSLIFMMQGMHLGVLWRRLLLSAAIGIFPLALLAASIQLLLSINSRAVKEAQTYLSMIMFLPMGVGMYLVFFTGPQRFWLSLLPLAGQQLHLQRLMHGRDVPVFESIVLGCLTLALAAFLVFVSSSRLQRDEIVYGS